MMNLELGYHIGESREEENRALHQAFDLVTRARRIGESMRLWAQKTEWESRVLLERLKKQRELTNEAKVWELACWENKILTALRNYMNESSDLMNGLRPLNPPLRTEQLKPFHEAIIVDRETTVEALQPLTSTVGVLTSYKTELGNQDIPVFFNYRPA